MWKFLSSSFLMVATMFVVGVANAHNPDTSYARFKVTRESLETRLTYDLVTLLKIAPRLDANGDRHISRSELAAQVPAITEFLRTHVKLEIDGRAASFGELRPVSFPPQVGDSIPEQDYHAATSLVHFVFHQPRSTPPADFWVRFEFFETLGAQQIVLGAIEQEGRELEVLFRDDEPDYLYDTDYVVTPSAAPSVDANTTSAPPKSDRSNSTDSPWRQWTSFFRLGVEHIFLGYDHILFLLSLIVVCRFTELVKIVTSFTLAHSITLLLASLEIVQLPARFVETSIAATIVYVAVENFWIHEGARRWPLTFFFGLIHGFGFAGVLKELGLPTIGLFRSLIAFNVGVEAGQLAIVLAIFPLSYSLAKWNHNRSATNILSALIALCGLGWFLDRALGLDLMPF